MPFDLQPYAAVLNGYVTRFIADANDLQEGEIALPVIADPDPPVTLSEHLWGPDYEVLEDRVRAYCTARPMAAHEIPRLTFAQLLIGLVAEGWLSEADGDGWLTGTLPAPVLGLISTLPVDHRFAAKARALRPSEVILSDPLVGMLAAAQGKTDDQLRTFFATYSQV